VLAQAASRLGEEGPPDLRARVERALQDLDLVTRLDAIRLGRAAMGEGGPDWAGTARGYAAAFAEAGLAREGDDPAETAGRIAASAASGPLVAALDDWACSCSQDAGRLAWLLEVARKADPDPWRDRARQPAIWRDRDALQKLLAEEAAIDQSPQLVNALSGRLGSRGGDEAGVLRRAQARHPDDFWLNFGLGWQLQNDEPAEAAGYYRAALALRPETAAAHYSLGNVLRAQGKAKEAEEEYHAAILLDSWDAVLHIGLGNVLRDQGKPKEAEEVYRTAIRLDPKDAYAHSGLGVVLDDQGKWQEAEEEYRTAIRLDPKDAYAHSGLGVVLDHQGKWQEAEAVYRAAARLGPKDGVPHYNLGTLLYWQGKLREAEEEFRAAVRLDSKLARPRYGLGGVLRDCGRFDEAKKEYQQAVDLGYQGATEEVRQCDRLIALAARLSAVLRGDDRPADSQEMLAFAQLCSLPFETHLRAAAQFYSEAFAADPRLADDLRAGHRYSAARCAALAGCGQGKDADKLDTKEKARLRRLALNWLRAYLASWAQWAQSHKPADRAGAQRALQYWKQDPKLAGVRGDALAKLPEAERAAWKKLWDDVDALLASVSAPEAKQ
jgi:Flp pilus assembly protein TadD